MAPHEPQGALRLRVVTPEPWRWPDDAGGVLVVGWKAMRPTRLIAVVGWTFDQTAQVDSIVVGMVQQLVTPLPREAWTSEFSSPENLDEYVTRFQRVPESVSGLVVDAANVGVDFRIGLRGVFTHFRLVVCERLKNGGGKKRLATHGVDP